MTKENWIKWLQAGIPALKESHNEFWVGQALDGFVKDYEEQLILNNTTKCRNCDEMVEMLVIETMCPSCFC